jgi:NADH dehydrogenase
MLTDDVAIHEDLLKANIPETDLPRVVIIGAGFGGLKLAKSLANSNYQVVLIDKYNYHQFQPLLYQVSSCALEPSSIAFPLRKIFQHAHNLHIRITEVTEVDTAEKRLCTSTLGVINYDYLVIATGTNTNFFGNQTIEQLALPMKSVPEAIALRNSILEDFEKAISTRDYAHRQSFLDIVIVGGGPTGVEIAGALAEMKKYIIPKDYTELDKNELDIYLVDGNKRLLAAMSDSAGEAAEKYLKDLGVNVITNTVVKDYDGSQVSLSDGSTLKASKLIWAAGVTGTVLPGMEREAIGRGNRILVNEFNQSIHYPEIYAVGDCALMASTDYPAGHPQMAQGAIQQADNLGRNLKAALKGKLMKPFHYKDLGSMATIGRNRAVVDLPRFKFKGFFAWFVWLFIHLMAILGTKNKLFIFLNWAWSYTTRDQSLRLIIRPYLQKGKEEIVA